MTDDLPAIKPLGYHPRRSPHIRLTLEQIHSFLAGVEPGWYLTTELHVRYSAWAEREGLTVITVKALGESLGRILRAERDQASGHRSVWNILEHMTKGVGPDCEVSTGQLRRNVPPP